MHGLEVDVAVDEEVEVAVGVKHCQHVQKVVEDSWILATGFVFGDEARQDNEVREDQSA